MSMMTAAHHMQANSLLAYVRTYVIISYVNLLRLTDRLSDSGHLASCTATGST